MKKPMTPEQAKKMEAKIRGWAERSNALRDKVSNEVERLKANPEQWKAFCELTGTAPESNGNDFLA